MTSYKGRAGQVTHPLSGTGGNAKSMSRDEMQLMHYIHRADEEAERVIEQLRIEKDRKTRQA